MVSGTTITIDTIMKWYDMYQFFDELYIYNYLEGRDEVYEYNLNQMTRYQVKLALELYILRNREVKSVEVMKYGIGNNSASCYELAFDFPKLTSQVAQVTYEEVVNG